MRPTSLAEIMEILVALRDQSSQPAANDPMRFMNYCLTHVTRSRSQFLQDMWVGYELGSKRDGFFVEFGGADGKISSNSYFLELELG